MKESNLNQEKMKSILQCISEGIIYQEANGTISFFNLVAQRLFSISESEARDRTSTHPEWHLVYEDGTPCPGEGHPSMITLSTGRPLTAEIRGIARPGQPVTWLSINTRPIVQPGQELPKAVVISFSDITARKQQEKILREIIDNNPMSLQILDGQGHTLQTNSAYLKLFGSVPPSGYSIFNDSQLLQMGMGKFFDQLRSGESVRFPDTYFNAHDSIPEYPDVPAWIRTFGFPLNDSDEKPQRFVLMHENITERKLAEEALRQSEERFRALFSSVSDPLLVADRDTGILMECNEAAERYFGRSREQLIGLPQRQLHPPDTLPVEGVTEDFKRQATHPGGLEEIRLLAAGGEVRCAEVSASLFEIGESRLILGVFRDVTKRKRAEAELKEANAVLAQKDALLRSMLHNLPFDFWARDLHQNMLIQSKESVRVWGDLTGTAFHEASVDPEYLAVWRATNARVLTGEVVSSEQDYAVCGEPRQFHAIVAPIVLAEEVQGILGINIDITERKQAEEALRESEGTFRNIVEASPMGIHLYQLQNDDRLVFVGANPAADKLLGVDNTKFIGMTLEEAFPPLQHTEVPSRYRRAAQRGESWYTEQIEYDHGTIAGAFEVYAFQMSLGKVAVLFNDITERKLAEKERERLQMQLTQAQKMEAIGQLAGGVAHDFNNMLGVIIGYSELILDQVDPSQPFRAELEEIQKAARRSADLTRQLLTFARKQTVAPKVLDLNQTVEGMLNMLRRLIGENIHLIWMPGNTLWPIKMDPSQIDQILANLCVNGRDAIAGVGKITVETENTPLNEEYCGTHAGFIPGEYVRIAVSDTGSGMDEDTLAHIFEPFFTTKGVGEGTGLGLATVYGAVKQNNGFINAYSEPGRGTTFTIYIPRYKDKVLLAASTVAGDSSPSGAETILVVEDEPMILKMTTQMLVGQGYHVLGATSSWEAIRLAKENAGAIDLLMTDVIMPEMNGQDLAKRLFAISPSIKCLFMSGYTASVIEPHGVLGDGVHFIQKPFTMKALAAAVREALDE